MIELFKNKTECCGCELCSQVCPTSIIEMKSDNEGFLYPIIIDPSKCIECHRCIKACPEKKRIISPRTAKAYYSGYSKDEEEIKKSASGGLATELAKSFIDQGGIVYGVHYSSDCLSINYERADTVDALDDFRGSKYAQARKGDVYKKILSDLKQDRRVLFIGLPCDVSSLYNFTRNKYENLYTVELVCHGVTSPLVHFQYIERELKKEESQMEYFSVRFKKNGWKPYYIRERFENGKEIFKQFRPTAYGIAFHYLKRPSCNTCRFKIFDKSFGLQADVTIGDNHGVEKTSSSYHKWGSSMAITHSDKGELLIASISNKFYIKKENSDIVSHNLALYKPFPIKANRQEFVNAFVNKNIFYACRLNSVRKREFKRKLYFLVTRVVISTCITLGLEKFRRKCTKKLRGLLKR